MKKLLALVCVCAVFAFTFAMAEEAAKPAEEAILVSATWVHPADGGEVTVVIDTKGQWTITKVFKPAKEGAKVPVIEPRKGQLMEKWYVELQNAVKAMNWAELKAKYKVSPQGSFTGDNCKMILGHDGKKETVEIGAEGEQMSKEIQMINNIVGILYQVRGN